MKQVARVPRLMAIRSLDPASGLEDWGRSLARDGVDCIHVRDRTASDRIVFESCRSLQTAIAATSAVSASLVVNRRPDIAAAAGAAGVHLPINGLPVAAVRAAFGVDFLIGLSTHSLEEVAKARRDGADYVVFGPVFATPEKIQFGPPQGLEELARATALGIPVLAIGGITEERLADVAHAGAAGAAAIRLFERSDRVADIVAQTRQLFQEAQAPAHV